MAAWVSEHPENHICVSRNTECWSTGLLSQVEKSESQGRVSENWGLQGGTLLSVEDVLRSRRETVGGVAPGAKQYNDILNKYGQDVVQRSMNFYVHHTPQVPPPLPREGPGALILSLYITC